jgi:Histidine kinase-, DNA gyrase B-, and HSP90-like ATPase
VLPGHPFVSRRWFLHEQINEVDRLDHRSHERVHLNREPTRRQILSAPQIRKRSADQVNDRDGTRAQDDAIPGVGHGLSITKAIVEAHGGRISVQSVEGEGTTFRVDLPAGPADRSAIGSAA